MEKKLNLTTLARAYILKTDSHNMSPEANIVLQKDGAVGVIQAALSVAKEARIDPDLIKDPSYVDTWIAIHNPYEIVSHDAVFHSRSTRNVTEVEYEKTWGDHDLFNIACLLSLSGVSSEELNPKGGSDDENRRIEALQNLAKQIEAI